MILTHRNADCGGGSVTVRNGGYVANLKGTNFQDNLESFSCFGKSAEFWWSINLVLTTIR